MIVKQEHLGEHCSFQNISKYLFFQLEEEYLKTVPVRKHLALMCCHFQLSIVTVTAHTVRICESDENASAGPSLSGLPTVMSHGRFVSTKIQGFDIYESFAFDDWLKNHKYFYLIKKKEVLTLSATECNRFRVAYMNFNSIQSVHTIETDSRR